MAINSWEDYRYLAARLAPELDPLRSEWAEIPIEIRIEIQGRLFGKQSRENDARFYRWIYDHVPHICEETQAPLHHYSAELVSHILSRGAHTEMRYDPRNVNLLCPEAHRTWETGAREEKIQMAIWGKNQRTITKLKQEYR